MKLRVKIGIIVIFMGTGAMIGNYLWLIGVAPKPSDELMSSRWLYAIFSYTVGSLIAWFNPV